MLTSTARARRLYQEHYTAGADGRRDSCHRPTDAPWPRPRAHRAARQVACLYRGILNKCDQRTTRSCLSSSRWKCALLSKYSSPAMTFRHQVSGLLALESTPPIRTLPSMPASRNSWTGRQLYRHPRARLRQALPDARGDVSPSPDAAPSPPAVWSADALRWATKLRCRLRRPPQDVVTASRCSASCLITQKRATNRQPCCARCQERDRARPGSGQARSIHPHTKFTGQVYVLSKERAPSHPVLQQLPSPVLFPQPQTSRRHTLPKRRECAMPSDHVKINVELITTIAIEEASVSPSAKAAVPSAPALSSPSRAKVSAYYKYMDAPAHAGASFYNRSNIVFHGTHGVLSRRAVVTSPPRRPKIKIIRIER